ncbi:MAG: beta-ketoacyl synthase N-terminal-like domain-containing protein, partial [Planctomycetia bacterium]
MKRRVVVTGLGVVTSLGRPVGTFWDRILRGDSGVGPITLFDVSGYRVQFGGQVNWVKRSSRLSSLGLAIPSFSGSQFTW